jgi:hypothetical protein
LIQASHIVWWFYTSSRGNQNQTVRIAPFHGIAYKTLCHLRTSRCTHLLEWNHSFDASHDQGKVGPAEAAYRRTEHRLYVRTISCFIYIYGDWLNPRGKRRTLISVVSPGVVSSQFQSALRFQSPASHSYIRVIAAPQ